MVTLPSARRIATPIELAFGIWFGLAPHLAALLAEMFAGLTITTFRTNIHKLRNALNSEAIDTTPAGYRLTETGLSECAQAVVEFEAWVTGGRSAA